MATVRAKFRVNDIQVMPNYGTTVNLHPVYGDSDENKSFFASTPSGDIRMTIKNEVAAAAFESGKEYYVDFTPAIS